jgi:DNA invertase Pin-like site-specific DNA recombinase
MKVIGYTRVSSDKQDLQKQEHLLLKYAQQQDLHIQAFINVEISSRRDNKARRINELLDRLDEGDVLLVAELSRFGRNMFEVIDIVNQLGESGVEVIFVRQPELSTTGPHRKLLLAIYSYFAEAEREFISIRTKQGLAAAKASAIWLTLSRHRRCPQEYIRALKWGRIGHVPNLPQVWGTGRFGA